MATEERKDTKKPFKGVSNRTNSLRNGYITVNIG